ncbi:LON peptidase substrate-binding domain-containing protein [Methylocella silvestris]|uniref:Peptidase S16 n=1 Tax=Methylocella silvestris TaxID=199596 RepID=A0A2J7TJ26_METSI|nr:LON peptidase substrate-binding domain-containing protein [Methylocella silvestris]PNG26784.1 peptidase S16 [Methylocella silvestris]
MGINHVYGGPDDLPPSLPIFPLAKALLLPRGQLPLNIFEPRYMAMVDDALKGNRLVGMIQPNPEAKKSEALFQVGCVGRITQLAETGDGRYLLTLTGVARFKIIEEIDALTPYRQARVDYAPFSIDFSPRAGEEMVDRDGLLRTLRSFAESNELQLDWDSINEAPNEALVNALAMMSPFGPREKQALLEATDLKGRADVLVAITEIELARGKNAENTLQ